jgi:hypothetical protein
LTLRSIRDEDLPHIRQLHANFFANEFQMPDFKEKYHCVYVMEHNGKIVVVGGVRPIAESVTITDKSMPATTKVEALRRILTAHLFTAGKEGYNQLHCFVQDPTWQKHLKKIGFRDTAGRALVLDI